MDGPIEEISEDQYRSNAQMIINNMDSASQFNGDVEKYMIDSVSNHFLNVLLNT